MPNLTEPPPEVEIARRFHEIYEEAAPRFGWETQAASRVPFHELPDKQRELMIYVAGKVLNEMKNHLRRSLEVELNRLKAASLEARRMGDVA